MDRVWKLRAFRALVPGSAFDLCSLEPVRFRRIGLRPFSLSMIDLGAMPLETQHLENPSESETQCTDVSALSATPAPGSPLTPTPRKMSNSERWLLGHPLEFRIEFGSSQPNSVEADRLQQSSLDEVLAILRTERQQRLKLGRSQLARYSGFIAFAFLLAKFAHISFLLDHWMTYVPMWILGAGVVVSRQEKEAALAISRFDDIRAVGPLAEALRMKDRPIRKTSAQALIRLLPRLQASDAFLISPAQRSCLNRALRGRNKELMLAILKAWEQVGDSTAISDVQNLAEGRGAGGRHPEIVRAAQECLPALRQSAGRVQIGSQLLRPSDGNMTPSGVLLRPAQPHTASDPPNQLLRPTDAA
jgi:hypothetical protein